MNPDFASSFRSIKLHNYIRPLLTKVKLFTFLEQEISKSGLFLIFFKNQQFLESDRITDLSSKMMNGLQARIALLASLVL